MAWQRKIPFGYQVQNGRINCHPEEAELVRAIFSRYLLGGSYSQIADEMTQQGVRYHQHTAQWNKHMVKRILENERYLGMDGYPQLVTDEEFLAVRLRRGEQNTYAPCPSEIIPIRDKAVCALCGEKMARDTKSRGRPRWRCKNPECGGSVYLDDSIILERVVQKLKVLAHSPECIRLPKAAPASTDALRIENELALCFNVFFKRRTGIHFDGGICGYCRKHNDDCTNCAAMPVFLLHIRTRGRVCRQKHEDMN